MPRHAVKGSSSLGMNTPRGEEQEEIEDGAPRLPRAGDTARQIGFGFFKMADVIDECPPLAKLFEGGFLEKRFQEVFQVPSAVLARSGAGAEVSEARDEMSIGSTRKRAKGAAAAAAAAGANRGGDLAELAREGAEGPRGPASPRGGGSASPKRGRQRGTRGSEQGVEAEAWPGIEEALKEPENEVVLAAEAGPATTALAASSSGQGIGIRARPAGGKARDESAKRGRKPPPPVPSTSGLAPAPPPRRAAAQALHRMSSLSSSSPSPPPPAAVSSPSPAVAPWQPAPAAEDVKSPATLVAVAFGVGMSGQGCTEESNISGGGTAEGKKKKKIEAAVEENLPWRPRPGVGRDMTENLHRAIAAASGSGATSSLPPRANTRGTGGGGGRAGSSRGPGAEAPKGEAGVVVRRTADDELLSGLDARVFRFVQAGACREDGCEVRGEAHCHRGPGCDCTSNSDTHRWPSELQGMLRHQERHAEWNAKPAFGKRVMVEFEERIYYPGTINTTGDNPKDIYHAKGRWGILFDDCTKDRFHDGATDVMVSNQPRPKSISEELRDYYLKQTNGRELLEGVKVIPGAEEEHGQSPVDNAGSKKKNNGKLSETSKFLKEPRDKPREAGGVTRDRTLQRIDNPGEVAAAAAAAAAVAAGGGGTGGVAAAAVPKKKKRKHKQGVIVAGAEGAAAEEEGRSAGQRFSSEWAPEGVDDGRSGTRSLRIGKSDKRGKRKKGTGSGGGGTGGVDESGSGGGGVDGDLPGARANPRASDSSSRSAANEIFHQTYVMKVEEKQQEEKEEEVRGAGEWREDRGGGSKRKKTGREQQRPSSGGFGSSCGGNSTAVEGADATSNHGPDDIVPFAPDGSDPSAMVVVESGSGGGTGVCDEDGAVEAVRPPQPPDARQRRRRQQQQQPPQQRLPPAARRKSNRLAIEEKETADGATSCHKAAAAAAAPRSDLATSGDGGCDDEEVSATMADVVPVLPASSASTAELTAAQVLVSGLGV